MNQIDRDAIEKVTGLIQRVAAELEEKGEKSSADSLDWATFQLDQIIEEN